MTMKMQTVFNYPDEETSLKILDLTLEGKVEEVYDILSNFYHVPRIRVIYDRTLFEDTLKNDKNGDPLPSGTPAYYFTDPASYQDDFSSNYINFGSDINKKHPLTVLHEFYHHLERIFGLYGIMTGVYQTADSWAQWFIRNIGDIGDKLYMVLFYPDLTSIVEIEQYLNVVKNENDMDVIRELKKKTKNFVTTKEVFYSRAERKYRLTPAGERFLGYITTYLNNYEIKSATKEDKDSNQEVTK